MNSPGAISKINYKATVRIICPINEMSSAFFASESIDLLIRVGWSLMEWVGGGECSGGCDGGWPHHCPGTSPAAVSGRMGDVWRCGDTGRDGRNKRGFSRYSKYGKDTEQAVRNSVGSLTRE